MAEPAAPHRWPLRVYYEDTDAGGIVYHAGYLRYAERARTEMLRAFGFDHPRLGRDHGVQFAVRRCVVDYLRPAMLDDEIVVETTIVRAGGASLDLRQLVLRDRAVLARLEIRLAMIDRTGRPSRVPQPLRERIAGHATGGATATGPGRAPRP